MSKWTEKTKGGEISKNIKGTWSNESSNIVGGKTTATIKEKGLTADTSEPATDDVFNIKTQSEFMSNFGIGLSKNLKDTQKNNNLDSLNPTNAIDAMITSLKNNGASDYYIAAVEELKQDSDILKALEHFRKSLDGEANMHDMRKVVPPETTSAKSKPTIDVGLNGEVFTGAVDGNKDNDLIRYSNYISGAGTTFGGFFTDIPSTLNDVAENSLKIHLRDYNKWKGKMEGAKKDISKLMKEELDFHEMFGDNPRRIINRSQTADMQDGTTRRSLAEIEGRKLVGKKNLALAQHELYSKKMVDASTKRAGAIKAKKMLGKVTNKIGYATTAFGVASGGVDIAAGDQMLSNAKSRYEKGEIDADEYDALKRDAQLRITGGAFAIGSGMHDLGKIIKEKIGKKIVQKMVKGGMSISKSATRMLVRFGSVVGGALSIGMGVMSMTKNVIAADAARKTKNYGRMAMYGVMAALDAVSIGLDAVSVAFDVIPIVGQAISAIIDLINTVVGLVNMVIGFFADMVDTRTNHEKVKQAFDEYVESAAFKSYIDKQAKVYKDQGYDIFKFIIDADSVNIKEKGFDSSKVDKTIIRKLSDKAIEDSTDRNLRIALRDASSVGRELKGRAGDDLILAGAGADTLYGEEGDDLLYGEEGNNTLYGGPGNDYLNGGTGRNKLFGGEGDDWMVVKPGIDISVDGGPGSDTVEVSVDFFNWYREGSTKTIKLGFGANHVQGCYVDLSYQNNNQRGRAGLSLGALINNMSELDRPDSIHQKAFTSKSSLEADLRSKFWAGGSTINISELSGKMLWFLAHDTTSASNTDLKYVTDGAHFYAHGRKEGKAGTWKGNFAIKDIASNIAKYDASTKALTYDSGKELEALLLFAFRGTQCVKNVEKVVESKTSNDIHSQIIGDNKTNLFDIMYGYNEYVYTGNGNNVVVMASSYSPEWKMWKYIVGGNGSNTLIINSSSRSKVPRTTSGYTRYDAGHKFILLEADIKLATANKATNPVNSNMWSGNLVDRGIYLKNINRIQLSAKYKHNANFFVDATNLSKGHTFIVDSDTETFRLIGTPGDDAIFIKNIARKSSFIDGLGGTNLITLENYESADSLTVTLGDDFKYGYIKGATISVALKNIQSVKGSHKVTSIEGNHRDNLLIATGGSTTVYGKGGRNTLVSMRGCHTFVSTDKGVNTYIISGPDLTEMMTITVTNVHKKGLEASSMFGTWQSGLLTIDLLKNEPSAIRLTECNIIDKSGKVISNKGSISMQDNKLLFRIHANFNHLKDHQSETIRVRYKTQGSTATITESGDGCVLNLSSFNNASELKVIVNANNDLEFQTLNGTTIFVDKQWGNVFKAGYTNPLSLMSDFGRRFRKILFPKSKTSLDYKGVFSMLKTKLSSLLTDATNKYDHINDLASIATPNMSQYTLGSGNHRTVHNVRNIKLVLGNGAHLVDISGASKESAAHSAGTVVVLGSGNTTVVLGTGRETVTVEGSSKSSVSLIFENIDYNTVDIEELHGPVYNLKYKGSLVAKLKNFTPSNMSFVNNGIMALIDSVPKYIAQRKLSKSYTHRLELADGKSKLKLKIPSVNPSDVRMSVEKATNGLRVNVLANDEKVYEFVTRVKELNVDYLAMRTRYEFRGGIQLSDGNKNDKALQDFVKTKLADIDGMSVLQASAYANVVSMSKKNVSQLTLTDAADMVLADRNNSTVFSSGGDDFVRVSASHVTVHTGKGKDIVFLQSGATNASIKLKADDNSYTSGRNCVVVEGVTGSSVGLFGEKDTAIPYYYDSGKAVKIKKDSTQIVELDSTPSCLLFKNGNEYEVIQYGRVLQYFRDHAAKKYVGRYFINPKGEMFFKFSDLASGDLKVKIIRYSSGYTTVRLHSASVFSLYQNQFQFSTSSVAGSDVTVQIAADMPGGIQFKDGTKTGPSFLTYLLGKIVAATTEGISISSSTWSESEAKSAFDAYLKKNNPTSYYTTIVANVNLSLKK